jgi:HAD superfamily hydrolase (TIGR01450 family)
LDASGVIYNDSGIIRGVKESIDKMKEKGSVFVVTNNSFQWTATISSHLQKKGIDINESHIISSGFGLSQNEEISSFIYNRNIYVYGSKDSHKYIELAKPKEIVTSIEDSNVIVLTSSYLSKNLEEIESIVSHINKKGLIPIICCNPDIFVAGRKKLIKVIGYYANLLENRIGKPILKIGKPLPNFSPIVRSYLKRYIPEYSSNEVCFFDDNLENVIQLQRDLKIHGCWIKDTGISKNIETHHQIKKYAAPNFILPSLNLQP